MHEHRIKVIPSGTQNDAYRWMLRQLESGAHTATWLVEDYCYMRNKRDWLDDPDHWVWDAAVLALEAK